MSFATDCLAQLERLAAAHRLPRVRALHLPPDLPPGQPRGEFCALELQDGSLGLSYVLLRSLHIVGAVWLGAAVLGAPLGHRAPAALVLASGLLMLVMDLRAGRMALRELAGAAVLAKLLLVVWMVVDRTHAAWALALLVLFSSVTSHAPKNVRHWPSPYHKRANRASKPG